MSLRGKELFSQEQRELFMKIPEDELVLAKYYTFSKSDLESIHRHRRDENKIGFALQLALLRYPGWPYSYIKSIPKPVISYIAKQIGTGILPARRYPQRDNTLWQHMKEIKEEYNFISFGEIEQQKVFNYIYKLSLENDDTLYLFDECLNFFRKNKIILPGITTIENLIWEAKNEAEKILFDTLNTSLSEEQKEKLNSTLLVQPNIEERSRTTLGWLKAPTGFPSPDTFLKLADKIEYIKDLNLDNSLVQHFHSNRLLQLYRMALRYEPYAFRDFKENKRYALLTILLINLSKDLIDKAFEVHDRQMLTLISKGRKAQEEIQKNNGKKLNEKIVQFANIGKSLIKAKEDGIDPFKALESIVDWESFVFSVNEAEKLARPIDYDYLDLLEKRFHFLRRYTPKFLNLLEFKSTKANESLIQGINILKEINESGKRKIPEDAPIDFISKRWSKYVFEKNDNINRHYYEMAVLSELREHIRAGDISISGSRQYMDFEEYLFSKDEWQESKDLSRLAVSLKLEDYMIERNLSLNKRLKWFSKNINQIKGISIENGKISISRLERNIPLEAEQLSSKLYKLIPRINLTDLLLDVANITGFHEEFIHASTNKKPDSSEKIILIATLIGMGTNIGLTKMADAASGISYKQMAYISQWRMHEDALNRAQANLVNFHNKLNLSKYWGDGTTSSSDGMRMQLGVTSLHADSNPHYGTGKGATIYRFTSDQFSSFYTKIINTNSRDATHVLDGLLNHETDLNILEHYTDTAGYTDQVFGLTHLLGFKFAPRIRDLSDVKLFSLNETDISKNVESILKGKINEKIIKENYDDVLRLASSIRAGKVSSSLILSKLGSYSRQNSISTALREMGKIEKTIFILDYLSNEELRRKIHRGLNKGEAMNGLARAIFFGKQGELRERTLQNQLQRASTLNIIINAINIWNTIYLEKALEYLKTIEEVDEDLLGNISPLAWEHINLLGEYNFDSNCTTSLEFLRELNIG